ncbi:MAG: pseudouridine synthase [Acidobacteriota bacterium]
MTERIQKVLSHAGVVSRREGERLLTAGRITVNGRVVTRLGTRIRPQDQLAVDGQSVRRIAPTYLLMYKPRNVVTTLSDPEGRATVGDLLPRLDVRVFPVGRLDYASEGLLLFTNDGALAQALLRPATHVPKIYSVKVRGLPDPGSLRRLRQPFRLAGRRTRPAAVRLVRGGPRSVVEVTLVEGVKNQIREMFWRVGHPVLRLRRIAIGPLRDAGLASGSCRHLTAEEVTALGAWVETPAQRVAR